MSRNKREIDDNIRKDSNLSSARVHKIVVDADIRLEQIGLDATRRLDSHLGAVLEDHNGELGTWHTGEPETEVLVNVLRVDLLDEALERGHPARRQVAVLEKHP